MKFQNLISFEKHLAQGPLAPIYLIAAPCSYERRKVSEGICSALQKAKGELEFHSKEAVDNTLEEMIEALNAFSIFGKTKVLYLDAVEKLKKNGEEVLARYVANPSPFSYLILGASAVKSLNLKGVTLCDLGGRKTLGAQRALEAIRCARGETAR